MKGKNAANMKRNARAGSGLIKDKKKECGSRPRTGLYSSRRESRSKPRSESAGRPSNVSPGGGNLLRSVLGCPLAKLNFR